MICIGHRGAAGLAPQNTISSFEKAIALGCDCIETDLHICKTGELVLCHDARIDSTSNGTGYIKDITYNELRSFDFGDGQQIMTLEELLELCRGKIDINIEMKSDGAGKAAALMLNEQIAAGKWSEENLLITSFNHPELMDFHALAPDIPIGALIKSILIDEAAYVKDLECTTVVVSLEFINKRFVEDMHAAGIKVYVYTVDDPRDIEHIIRIGVDGIIGNYPDRILEGIHQDITSS